jgi:quercetin dioxygenase-like cupin family protein
MDQHYKWMIAATVVAAAGSALISAPVGATAASGFTAAQQWKGQYPSLDIKLKTDTFDLKLDTKGSSDVYVTRNAIAAGGQSGWHTHPGPSLITVTIGEVTAYDDQLCTPIRYQAGQSFIDQGDGHVHLLRNETSAAAETLAVQFIARDAVRRIDAPQPNNCNF